MYIYTLRLWHACTYHCSCAGKPWHAYRSPWRHPHAPFTCSRLFGPSKFSGMVSAFHLQREAPCRMRELCTRNCRAEQNGRLGTNMLCTREAGKTPLVPNSRNMPRPNWILTIFSSSLLLARRGCAIVPSSTSRQVSSGLLHNFFPPLPKFCLLLPRLPPLGFSASRWMQWHSHEPGGVMG